MKKYLLIFFVVMMVGAVKAETNDNSQLSSDQTLLQKVIAWYDRNTNYGSIMALMAVESSFIPFPSEVVIPPAAYIASEETSDLNIFLVVLFGTIGALIGAYINYFLALWLGRPIIYKFADTGIKELILQMIKAGAKQDRIVAKIAGGAKMFEVAGGGSISNVGDNNAAASRAVLAALRIPLKAEDPGLNYGRTVEIYSETGEYKIKAVGKDVKVI